MDTPAINFSAFRNTLPERNVNNLPAGWHTVRVSRIQEITDRSASLTEKKEKEREYEWNDVQPVLAIVYSNKAGSIVHRYNAAGFVRFDELPAKEQKNFFASKEGYAVNVKTKGRLIDTKRTADAGNILNNVFAAAKKINESGELEKLPESGCGIEDLAGCTLDVHVEAHTYDGKPQLRVIGHRLTSVGMVKAETF